MGWLNNPANPKYPANRRAVPRDTYEDARDPQDWPYPEKVMGWAGHPVEILESPGTLVAGLPPGLVERRRDDRPGQPRAVKPPVDQFCTSSNNCVPGAKYTPNAPEVLGEPAGPCAHKNASGQYDLKCWCARAEHLEVGLQPQLRQRAAPLRARATPTRTTAPHTRRTAG